MKPKNVNCRKTLLGKYEVTYDCPGCGKSLKNDLDDAGKQDQCPHCECDFFVPGTQYKQELERRRAERLARKEKESERREAEAIAKESERREAEAIAKESERREAEAIAREFEARTAQNFKLISRTSTKRLEALIGIPQDDASSDSQKTTDNRTPTQFISEGMAELVRAFFHSFLCSVSGSLTLGCASIANSNDDTLGGLFAILAILFALGTFAFAVSFYFAIMSAIEAFDKGSKA